MAINAKKLYEALKADPNYEGIGSSFESFQAHYSNPENGVKLYEALKADPAYEGIGSTFDNFRGYYGLAKKASPPESGSPSQLGSSAAQGGGSTASGQPTPSSSASGAPAKSNPFFSDPLRKGLYAQRTDNAAAFVPGGRTVQQAAATDFQLERDADIRAQRNIDTAAQTGDPTLIGKDARLMKSARRARREELASLVDFTPQTQEQAKQTWKDIDAQVEREQAEFAARFYDGDLKSSDITMLRRGNPIGHVDGLRTTPEQDSATAAAINRKTKNLADWAASVRNKGVLDYAKTKDSLLLANEQQDATIALYEGRNEIRKEGDQWVAVHPDFARHAEAANRAEAAKRENATRIAYLDTQFQREELARDKALFRQKMDEKLAQLHGGKSVEEIMQLLDEGGDAGGFLKLGADGKLSAESARELQRLTDEVINQNKLDAIRVAKHGPDLQVGGGLTALLDDVNRTLFNQTGGVLGSQEAESGKDKGDFVNEYREVLDRLNLEARGTLAQKKFEADFAGGEGRELAPLLHAQGKIRSYFGQDRVRAIESGIKASQDAAVLDVTAKYAEQLEAHPAYTEVAGKWLQAVAEKKISRDVAEKHIEADLRNNLALKPLFEARQKEINAIQNAANEQRVQYLTEGVQTLGDGSLVVNPDGTIGVKGVTPERMKELLQKYEQGSRAAFTGRIAEVFATEGRTADVQNLAGEMAQGRFGNALSEGFREGGNGMLKSLYRWLYHKTGHGLDEMQYFQSQEEDSRNVGEYAARHFKYNGLASLVDPAFYGHAAGQSAPYMLPTMAAGLVTGGSGAGVVLGGVIGGTLESATNALHTYTDVYENGKLANGMNASERDASRAAAKNFSEELLPNIALQALEFRTLLRASPLVRPTAGVKGVVSGVGATLQTAGQEAVQEGLQGYIQQGARAAGEGRDGDDLWDYMQTDDFRQNFFGGLAGGMVMGGVMKPIGHYNSLRNWEKLASGATAEVRAGLPYSFALVQEQQGKGDTFRDGLRLSLLNEDYKNEAEKVAIERTLAYSESLRDNLRAQDAAHDLTSRLYAAHNLALSDLSTQQAAAHEGTAMARVYQQRASQHAKTAMEAIDGTANVYYVEQAGAPVFLSEQSAEVLLQEGRTGGLNSNNPAFNQRLAEARTAPEQPTATQPSQEAAQIPEPALASTPQEEAVESPVIASDAVAEPVATPVAPPDPAKQYVLIGDSQPSAITVENREDGQVRVVWEDGSAMDVTPEDFGSLFRERTEEATEVAAEAVEEAVLEEGLLTETEPGPSAADASVTARMRAFADRLEQSGPMTYSSLVPLPGPKTMAKAVRVAADVIDSLQGAVDAVAQGVQAAVRYIRENHEGEIDEAALTEEIETIINNKPVRRKNETMAEHAVRVLEWRKRMLASGDAAKQADALANSQAELDYVKRVNEGIDLLQTADLKLDIHQFNRAMGLPPDNTEFYVAAIKYFKSARKEAAAQLDALRRGNPRQVVQTEMQLLNQQVANFARGHLQGAKETKAFYDNIRAEIKALLKEYNDAGLLAGTTYTEAELLRFGGYINAAFSERGFSNLLHLLTRLVDEAELGRVILAAKDYIKRGRRLVKGETIPANDVAVITALVKLNPLRVQDIDRFVALLRDAVDGRIADTGHIKTFTNQQLLDYVEDQRQFALGVRADELRDKWARVMAHPAVQALVAAGKIAHLPSDTDMNQHIRAINNMASADTHEQREEKLRQVDEVLNWLRRDATDKVRFTDAGAVDPASVTAAAVLDYTKIGEHLAAAKAQNQNQNVGKNRDDLEQQAKAYQDSIDTTLPVWTDEQRAALQALVAFDVTGMGANQLRLFINTVDNIILNEDLSGYGYFQVKKAAQDTVKAWQAFLDDSGYVVRQESPVNRVKDEFSSTEQQVWDVGNNARKLTVQIYNTVGFDDLKSGYKRALKFMQEQVADKINRLITQEGLRQSPETNVRLTMYSLLNQNRAGNQAENEAEFNSRLKKIKRDLNVKAASESNAEEAAAIRREYADLRQRILDARGIDIDAAEVTGLDNTVLDEVNFLTPVEKQAYEVMRAAYEQLKPEFRRIAESVLNKEFEEWSNYMVDAYRRLDGGLISEDISPENFGQSVFGQVQAQAATSGSFNSRVEGNTINEVHGENSRVLNYNWFMGQWRNAQDMAFDVETLEARTRTYEVLNDKIFYDSVGEMKHSILKGAVLKELKAMTGAKHGVENEELLKVGRRAVGLLGELAAKRQLFSISAFFKQAMSAWANISIVLGKDAGYMVKAFTRLSASPLRRGAHPDAAHLNALLDQFEISLRGQTRAGTNIFRDKNLGDVNARLKNSLLGKALNGATLTSNLTGEKKIFMGWFLQKGDLLGARTAWIALYAKYLTDNGLAANFNAIDWAAEAAAPNREAAAYAGLTTSKQLNTNSTVANGRIINSPQAGSTILKGMFGLFGMFGFNKSVGILNNASDIKTVLSDKWHGDSAVSKEQQADELRTATSALLGGLMEEIVFQGVKWVLVRGGLGWLMFTAFAALMDDGEDETDPALKKKKKAAHEAMLKAASEQMNKGAEKFWPNVFSNYLFSLGGSQGQEYLSQLANWGLKKAGEDPWFYERPSNPNRPDQSGLLYSAFGETAPDLQRVYDVFFRGTDEEGNPITGATREERAWSVIALASEVLQGFGLNDADVNRLIQRRVQQFDGEINKRLGKPFFFSSASSGKKQTLSLPGGAKVRLTEAQVALYEEKKKEFRQQYGKNYETWPEPMQAAFNRQAAKYADGHVTAQYGHQFKDQLE